MMMRSIGLQTGSVWRVTTLALIAAAALLLLHDAPNAAWAQGRTIPSVPQNVTVTPGDASLTLTWEAPSSWGDFLAGGYDVDWYAGASPPADSSDWKRATLTASPLAATATSYTFTGTYEGHTVANGTTYQLRVRAFSVNPKESGDTLPSRWVVASGTPRPASRDATLSDLTIANATTGSDASTGGVWAYGPRVYTAVMLQEITSVTVRPTAAAGDLATITVQLESGGTLQTVASGADSAAIAVPPHADPDEWHNIIVTVTAENGDALAYTLRVYQYPPVSFGATVPTLTFTQGARVEHRLPSASDDYEVTYTATGLPAGLSLSSVHRAIVGTPTAATTAPATVTYTATGEFGSTASLTFQVSVAPPVTFDAAARRFCNSTLVAFTGGEWLDAGDDGTITYPAASGGAGTLTYSLIESDSQQPLSSVASGITFDTATRKLGGMPTEAAQKTWSVTYAAEDENGSRAACTTAVHAGGFGGI